MLLEFPTLQAAIGWYNGAAYAHARTVREGAAAARVYVVDGAS